MPARDPAVRRRHNRRHYARHAQQIRAAVAARRKATRDWWNQYRSTLACARCSEHHPATLDMHHVEPHMKDRAVALMVRDGLSIERIKREIAKCIVLCSNCHRKEHWTR